MSAPSSALSFEGYHGLRHFGTLDGVRALSITSVIMFHSAIAPPMFPEFGFLGVDSFFVLSGFLIVTLILREKAVRGQINLRDFYVRRTLRIFPLYYALFFGTMFVFVAAGHETKPEWLEKWPFYAFYVSNFLTDNLPNWSPAWSLASEEQFYLMWPFIERFLPRRAVWGVLAVALGLNLALAFGLFDPVVASVYPGERPELVQATFSPILMGVVLAHVLHHRPSFALFARAFGYRHVPLLAVVAIALLLGFAPHDISGTVRTTFNVLVVIGIGSAVIVPGHSIAGVMGSRPFVKVGLVSYGMYLFHMWTIHVARAILGKLGFTESSIPVTLAIFVPAFLMSYVAAEFSFRYFERPFLRLKKRFETPKADLAPAKAD